MQEQNPVDVPIVTDSNLVQAFPKSIDQRLAYRPFLLNQLDVVEPTCCRTSFGKSRSQSLTGLLPLDCSKNLHSRDFGRHYQSQLYLFRYSCQAHSPRIGIGQ